MVIGRTSSLTDLSTAVPGFKVCVFQDTSVPCVVSDSLGDFQLPGVPASSEVLLEFTRASYYPVLRTVTTHGSATDIGNAGYPSLIEANAFASIVGTTIDNNKGQVLFSALQPALGFAGQDGVTASMTPASGSGPFYVSAAQLPDPTLTTTSEAGFGLDQVQTLCYDQRGRLVAHP